MTFIDFYCLINTRFWITNEKKFIKKSLLVMYISSFLTSFLTNCELKIRVKTFKNQKYQKSQKSFLVTFIA